MGKAPGVVLSTCYLNTQVPGNWEITTNWATHPPCLKNLKRINEAEMIVRIYGIIKISQESPIESSLHSSVTRNQEHSPNHMEEMQYFSEKNEIGITGKNNTY